MSQATAAAGPVPEALPNIEFRVLLDSATLLHRVRELGTLISRDYSGKDLVMVAILKGAQIFACDLLREVSVPVVIDFISISRYKRSSETTGVRITRELEIDIRGRDVLIIEDIVDTGLTLDFLTRRLKQREPASVAICTLLDRPDLRLAEIPMRYVGFNVSEEFLVGYGLDYREQYRNLPFIAAIEV